MVGSVGVEETEVTQVPNPMVGALRDLRAEVTASRDSIESALDSTWRKMTDGSTWTGPTTAEAWTEEVAGRRSRLGPLMQQVIDDIDAQIQSLDEMVTTEEARATHNYLRMIGA